jgi:phage shock protein PspC (stress-responsive transcriptional regulator)
MQQVVDTILVGKVIAVLGMPEGNASYTEREVPEPATLKRTRRLFRDPDHTVFGGVCSGLAAYFNIDVLLMRVLFFAAFFLGLFGFWIYIILWIVAPKANTVAEKLEMRGEPVTVENIWNYSKKYSKR